MQWVWIFLNTHLNEEFSQGIIYIVRTQDFPGSIINYPLIRRRTSACQGVRNIAFCEKNCVDTMWMIATNDTKFLLVNWKYLKYK